MFFDSIIKYFRLLIFLTVILLCIPIFVSHTLAASILEDNFSSHEIDTAKWNVLNETNIDLIINDSLNVRNIDSYRSVFLQNLVPIAEDDTLEYIFRFKFNSMGFGSGIALNDVPVNLRQLNSHPGLSDWTIFVWPTSVDTFKIFSVSCVVNDLCLPTDNPVFTVSDVSAFEWHTLSVRYVSGRYHLKLDDQDEKITLPISRPPRYLWIGNPMVTQGVSFANFLLDYVKVHQPPSTFPYLSQIDPLWADKEYDSASQWAGLEKSGIGRWGCALTSAAMMLQHYDVQTATGSAVTPDGLNDWLKNEPDGYLGLGHVNWLAISRFARQSYEANHASTKLEFVRSYPPSTPELPVILGLPGHFVVAHGEDTTSWKINDPASTTKQSLEKTSTVKSINKFVPSSTDLSYMLLVVDSDVTATLTDDNGTVLPTNWIDEYLTDESESTTGPSIRTLMVPKPSNGKYHLVVNRPVDTERTVKVYLYDVLGDTTPQILPLQLPTTYFEIQYGSGVDDVRKIVEVDRTPPPIPTLLSPQADQHLNTAGLVLDWSDVDDPSAPVTYYYKSTWPGGGRYGPVSTGTNSFIPANGTPDNTYTWQVQACDSAGNCSDWAQRQLIVDSTQPTVDLVFPPPGPSSNYFEATFSELVDPVQATNAANYYLSNWPGAGGSGDLAGDANITYNPDSHTARIVFINSGWYISSEQLWGVQNIADLAGNVLKINPYSEYSTQMIAPILPAAPTTNPNPVASLTQTWSWLAGSDSGSGIAGYSTRIHDNILGIYTSEWAWIGTFLSTMTNLGEGNWTMSLQARDRAGNVSLAIDSNPLVVDITPPTPPSNLHFDNPSLKCGEFTNSKTILVDWDDASDTNGVASYEYNIDYPLVTGGGRGSWSTTLRTSSYRGSLNEGTHYIKIRTKDNAGNLSAWSNSCAITYDSQMPKLLSQTAFNGWYSEMQTSYFDYADPNMTEDYLAPWCEIATEGVSESCQIIPNVCDKAGNCNTTPRQSNLAMIDLGQPSLKLLVWGRTLSGTASDRLSGIDKVEIRLTKPTVNETNIVATGKEEWSYTINDALLGHYKAVIVAYDYAGNVSEELNIEYDLNPASPAQGTNITTTPTPTPSPAGLVQGAMTQREITAEEEIQPSVASDVVSEPTPQGEVLGTETNPKPRTYVWWLLLPGLVGILLFLIARIAH